MRILFLALAALPVLPRVAQPQSEAALRAAFEGKTVTVRVDMPATSKGIDVYPQQSSPVNWREMGDRMKEYGTALKPGQQVMITKVLVKKDTHIEFQLGGGGWGTFGDFMNSGSDVTPTTESETAHERDLRARIKAAQGPTERKRLEKELANARSARERDNDAARAQAAQANAMQESVLRAKRAESGSRFNVRYRDGIPPYTLTPQGLAEALAAYVEIPGLTPSAVAADHGGTASGANGGGGNALVAGQGAAPARGEGAVARGSAQAVLALRKGLLLTEVEALLGPAASANEGKEGTLAVMKRGYSADGKRIATLFVNGVLVDFTIAPQ